MPGSFLPEQYGVLKPGPRVTEVRGRWGDGDPDRPLITIL